MTSEDKFKEILRYFDDEHPEGISWLKDYLSYRFHQHQLDIKYPKLYSIIEKYSKNWISGKEDNSKILVVELVYKQFKDDGLI